MLIDNLCFDKPEAENFEFVYENFQCSSTVENISRSNKQRNGGLKMGLNYVNETMSEVQSNVLLARGEKRKKAGLHYHFR